MSLTRRQIRLLTISAGDHERLPEDEGLQESDDLNTAPTDFEIKSKHINRIRKAVKGDGGKIGYKSPVVDKYIGRHMNVKYKEPTNPVKNRIPGQSKDNGNIKGLIDMARKGQGNIALGNKLKKKLQR